MLTEGKMGKADLHIHTAHSNDGTATVAAVLEYVARHTDLDVIAITDHDKIEGALEAVALAPRYGIEVIPGSEVTTADGHLLALYITETVPAKLSLVETVDYVAQLGGICIAPHPGGRWGWCLQEHHLRHALNLPHIGDTLVGIEEYNASLPDLRMNQRAAAMQRRLDLAHVSCSDAHLLWMIGITATCFPGTSAQDLRKALRERTTTMQIQPRPRHFVASYLWRQLLRSVGYVQSSPTTPGSQIALRRLTGTMRYA